MSPIVVERRARTDDPAAGAFQDAAILARSWRSSRKLISIRSGGDEDGVVSRTALANQEPSSISRRFWRVEAVSPNRPI
jgi:hypothetical protein